MQLQNEHYCVSVTSDALVFPKNICTAAYDAVYGQEEHNGREVVTVFSVEIRGRFGMRRIALVGDELSVDYHCAVLEEHTLTVLQNKRVRRIHLETGEMLMDKLVGSYGCNWAIYSVENCYVIHGEEEITMLDRDLCKKWDVSAREIYASRTKGMAFEIEDGIIKVYDFEDTYYEYDLNGMLLREILAEERSDCPKTCHSNDNVIG